LIAQPAHELGERADRAALGLDLDRAAREALGEKSPAFSFGELGRLDHADLGEQRDLDHELELLRAERELVVAQVQDRLIGRRVVERDDRCERRSGGRVERCECLRPVSESLPRLLDQQIRLDKWGHVSHRGSTHYARTRGAAEMPRRSIVSAVANGMGS
jgi:hypothetical protein